MGLTSACAKASRKVTPAAAQKPRRSRGSHDRSQGTRAVPQRSRGSHVRSQGTRASAQHIRWSAQHIRWTASALSRVIRSQGTRASLALSALRESSGVPERKRPVEVRREKETRASPTTRVGALPCPSGIGRSCWGTLIIKIVSGKTKGTATGADKLYKTKNMPTHK